MTPGPRRPLMNLFAREARGRIRGSFIANSPGIQRQLSEREQQMRRQIELAEGQRFNATAEEHALFANQILRAERNSSTREKILARNIMREITRNKEMYELFKRMNELLRQRGKRTLASGGIALVLSRAIRGHLGEMELSKENFRGLLFKSAAQMEQKLHAGEEANAQELANESVEEVLEEMQQQ